MTNGASQASEADDADDKSAIPVEADKTPVDGQTAPTAAATTAETDAPKAMSAPVAGRSSSPDRWSRRSVVLTSLSVLTAGVVGGSGWYFSARSDERDEQAAAREREKHAWELPPQAGGGIKVIEAVAGDYVPNWPYFVVSGQALGKQDFPYGADRSGIYPMIFGRGGAWFGRVSIGITVECVRRTVLITGAQVKARNLGPIPDATIFAFAPTGGPGEEAPFLDAGINLDAPRPTLRMLQPVDSSSKKLEERDFTKRDRIVLGDPFPNRQITLGAHDVRKIRVVAEARAGYYELDLSLEILTDGEQQVIPVKVTNLPLRIAAPVNEYRTVLKETLSDSGFTLGVVEITSMDDLKKGY